MIFPPRQRSRYGLNFWRSLIAVLIGNAIYFLLVSPNMPEASRHHRFAIDVGLVVDFWVCLVVYGLLLLIGKKKAKKSLD